VADELETVEQQFVAEFTEYLDEMQDAIDRAREFADANLEASAALDDLRDHTEEAAAALDSAGDAAAEAGEAIDDVRDHAAEAGAALDDMRDADAEAAESDDRLRDSALEAGEALGHVRDEALLAAAAMHEFRDSSHSLSKDAEDAADAVGGEGGLVDAMSLLGIVVPSVTTGIWLEVAAIAAAGAMLLGPFIAGAFAAAASIGAFAAFAVPEFSKIWAAVTGGKKAMDALSGPERQVAEQGRQIVHMFDQMAKAVRPYLLQDFSEGLKLVRDLMPSLQPLAIGAAKALDQLLTKIVQWVNSPSGKEFLHWLDTEGPKAMMDFAGFLWDLANVVGRTFSFLRNEGHSMARRFMENMHSIRVAFDDARHAIAEFGHSAANEFDHDRHALADLAHNYAAHFSEMRHDVATWAHDTAHDFDDARHAVADWAHNTAAHFDEVRHDIATWGHDVAQDFDDARHDIAEWAHDVAQDFDDVRHDIATWGHDVATDFDDVRHDIATWADDIVGIFSTLLHLIEDHWSTAWHDLLSTAKTLLGDVTSTIKNGVADFGSLLYNAGVALVSGLIHGIESMFGAVGSVVSSLAHKVAGFFGLSPAIEGPLSGGGAPYIRGLHFAMDIADGILAGHAAVAAAVKSVANTAGLVDAGTGGGSLALAGGGYGAGGAAAGGGGRLTVDVNLLGILGASNPQLRQLLQKAIQECLLDYASRNPQIGLIPYGRPGWRG
jgi:hypothetical protein